MSQELKSSNKSTSEDNQKERHSAYTIIQKKRDGEKLTKSEIDWIIESLVKQEIADYQMASLLMAIYLNGMDKEETKDLTNAMLYSGEVFKYDDPNIIDKHSTGGVGDKTSFILAPIAAACGVKVPMMAGRGLGHTGGTVDKIESVSGFKTDLSTSEFKKLLLEKGIVLIGQTGQIAPADKKIYALRDVTATIESIPLITASIMSKKLAEGANGIVMDIKVGDGAFMKSLGRAKKLAKSLTDTGVRFKKHMMCVVSDMNQPLGNMIGNSLEIIESVDVLKGKGPKDLTELSLYLAGGMIHLAGLAKTHKAGIKKAKASIKDGSALKKFVEMLENQGGDSSFVENYDALPIATEVLSVKAPKNGYIKDIQTTQMGLHCVTLGGGRHKTSDKIDFGVGFVLNKKVGDKVKEGEEVLKIYHNPDQAEVAKEIANQMMNKDYKFSKNKPSKLKPLIYETYLKWGH